MKVRHYTKLPLTICENGVAKKIVVKVARKTPANQRKAYENWKSKKLKEGFGHWNCFTNPKNIQKLKDLYSLLKQTKSFKDGKLIISYDLKSNTTRHFYQSNSDSRNLAEISEVLT